MKQPLTKRERVIVVVSALLLLGAGIFVATLYQAQQANANLIESQAAQLQEKDKKAGETAYIETICAEYRKLYQSYREARYPDPSSVDKYIGLPGSAKCQIVECYLTD